MQECIQQMVAKKEKKEEVQECIQQMVARGEKGGGTGVYSADGCERREEEEVQECIQQMVAKEERKEEVQECIQQMVVKGERKERGGGGTGVYSADGCKRREKGGGTGVYSADGCESREEEVQECIQQMVAKEERRRRYRSAFSRWL